MARNTLSRVLHDLGLSAWFGGTLANAIALNPAAGEATDPRTIGAVTNAGWDRWTPVNAAAIGVHLVGSLGQLGGNIGRVHGQKGVASMTMTKTAVTAAALGVTAYGRMLGRRVSKNGNTTAAESGTTPDAATPADVAAAQRQLALLQWAVPALTGALVVISAFAGEQQRASEVHKGVLGRVPGVSSG